MEHASVVSFAHHLLDLLAVGGIPPDILMDVATSAADEVRHAQDAMNVAELLNPHEYGDRRAPGPLLRPNTNATAPLTTPSLPQLAVALVAEGCVGETASAAVQVGLLGDNNAAVGSLLKGF